MKVRRLTSGDEKLACNAVVSLKSEEERAGHRPEVPFMTKFLAQKSNYLFVVHEQETPLAFALGFKL